MAYFISDEDSKQGKDPNIHIIGGIHNIKGKTYVNILIDNYTNKHIYFSIHQMKPDQLDWQKLVFFQKIYSVTEK